MSYKDIYIKDLLEDNKKYQNAVNKYQHEYIPHTRKKMLSSFELYAMAVSQGKKDLIDKLLGDCAKDFIAYCSLISAVYIFLNLISQNLNIIRGLRNGTIKEI